MMGRGTSGIMLGKLHVYSETESLAKIQEVFAQVMEKYGDGKTPPNQTFNIDELMEDEDEDEEDEEEDEANVLDDGEGEDSVAEDLEGEEKPVAPWLRKKNGAA